MGAQRHPQRRARRRQAQHARPDPWVPPWVPAFVRPALLPTRAGRCCCVRSCGGGGGGSSSSSSLAPLAWSQALAHGGAEAQEARAVGRGEQQPHRRDALLRWRRLRQLARRGRRVRAEPRVDLLRPLLAPPVSDPAERPRAAPAPARSLVAWRGEPPREEGRARDRGVDPRQQQRRHRLALLPAQSVWRLPALAPRRVVLGRGRPQPARKPETAEMQRKRDPDNVGLRGRDWRGFREGGRAAGRAAWRPGPLPRIELPPALLGGTTPSFLERGALALEPRAPARFPTPEPHTRPAPPDWPEGNGSGGSPLAHKRKFDFIFVALVALVPTHPGLLQERVRDKSPQGGGYIEGRPHGHKRGPCNDSRRNAGGRRISSRRDAG